MIFPSGWRASWAPSSVAPVPTEVRTYPLPLPKVASSWPVGRRRTTVTLDATPGWTPPMRIFPSGCTMARVTATRSRPGTEIVVTPSVPKDRSSAPLVPDGGVAARAGMAVNPTAISRTVSPALKARGQPRACLCSVLRTPIGSLVRPWRSKPHRPRAGSRRSPRAFSREFDTLRGRNHGTARTAHVTGSRVLSRDSQEESAERHAP